MKRVFSMEEIPDPFWAPPPPPLQPQMITGGIGGVGGLGGGVGGGGGGGATIGAMNRRPSGWYFQKFLEETLLDDPAPPAAANPSASVLYPNPMADASERRGYCDEVVEVIPVPASTPAPAAAAASAVVDPVEYSAMLKRKLDADLAAVAMWRASGTMHPASSLGNRALPSSCGSNLGSQNYSGGNGILVQNKLGGGPSGGSGPYLVQNANARVKQATSSSSREPSPSDDHDMEGETDRMGNMNLTEEKVKKRKQSNRESARRSRSRKAAHLKDLEEQVSQLGVENSSLLRRLADVSQKYNDAAVDNRVLKADVETLKTKVKMAEETVKRVAGTSQLPRAISGMSSLSIPISGSPSDATSDASVPIQDNPITYFATATDARVNNSYMPEIDPTFRIEDVINGALTTGVPTSSMDQTASQGVTNLGHLQRRVCGAPTSSGSAPWRSALLDPNELVNMEMQ